MKRIFISNLILIYLMIIFYSAVENSCDLCATAWRMPELSKECGMRYLNDNHVKHPLSSSVAIHICRSIFLMRRSTEIADLFLCCGNWLQPGVFARRLGALKSAVHKDGVHHPMSSLISCLPWSVYGKRTETENWRKKLNRYNTSSDDEICVQNAVNYNCL